MPITNVPAIRNGGDTQARCINCQEPIEPCGCVQMTGHCNPPFRGLRHVVSASHMCGSYEGFAPGAKVAEQ